MGGLSGCAVPGLQVPRASRLHGTKRPRQQARTCLPRAHSRLLAILSSKVLTMMPSGSEVASRAISFRTVLKNFLASGGWNSIFLKE